MIAADQFLKCDVRIRQAKQNPDRAFGSLALNICGGFLQLPPVDRDGSRRSLATPLNDTGKPIVENPEPSASQDGASMNQAARAESRQGREILDVDSQGCQPPGECPCS